MLNNNQPKKGGPNGVLIPFPTEPWLTKQQVAAHLKFSTRWVEKRVTEGMPCRRFGGQPRFQLSAVEAWLFEQEAC